MKSHIRLPLLVIALCTFSWAAQAGFVDSVSHSAEGAGNYVERKSGSRSDTKKFPIHRISQPSLKIQTPASFKVSNSKSEVNAVDKKNGMAYSFRFESMKQQAGLDRLKKQRQSYEADYKAGKYLRVKERPLNDVVGWEAMKLNGSDKNGARTYKWEGYDSDRGRYIIITANFGPNKYEGVGSADFETMLSSLKWDYKK